MDSLPHLMLYPQHDHSLHFVDKISYRKSCHFLTLPYFSPFVNGMYVLISLEVFQRIYLRAIDQDLKVQMRTRADTGIAAEGNPLSLLYRISH